MTAFPAHLPTIQIQIRLHSSLDLSSKSDLEMVSATQQLAFLVRQLETLEATEMEKRQFKVNKKNNWGAKSLVRGTDRNVLEMVIINTKLTQVQKLNMVLSGHNLESRQFLIL